MKKDTKKILVVGGAGLLALMLLGGKDVPGTITNIFEAPDFPAPGKDSGKEDPTADFVSPDPDLTYKQWSAGYQKHLVEKYPIKSIKRPDIDLTILDVLNVGGEDPAGIVYDVPAKADSKLSETKDKLSIPTFWSDFISAPGYTTGEYVRKEGAGLAKRAVEVQFQPLKSVVSGFMGYKK